MHSLLEDYLAEVAAHLVPLPLSRRSEELQELRQHLLNAIIVNREYGQSEVEAAINALDQFGTAQSLGDGIIQAWRREQKLLRRDYLGAIASAVLVASAMQWAVRPLDEAYWNWAVEHHHWNPLAPNMASPWFWVFYAFDMALQGIAVGIVTGLIFPKRAVAGAGLAAYIYATIAVTRWIYFWIYLALHFPKEVYSDAFGFLQLISYVFAFVAFCLATICGARVSSQWRLRHTRLMRA